MKSRIAAERLRDLQSVTDAALAYLPLEDLLNELLRRVVGILDADTAAILLLEDDDKTLAARAAHGLEEEVERGVRFAVVVPQEGLIERVLTIVDLGSVAEIHRELDAALATMRHS